MERPINKAWKGIPNKHVIFWLCWIYMYDRQCVRPGVVEIYIDQLDHYQRGPIGTILELIETIIKCWFDRYMIAFGAI